MQLAKSGFTHITLAVNHLSHLIMSYFGDGSKWGLKLDYSLEEDELSTIGPLTLINNLPDNFLVMNGDILCDLDYGQFLKNHIKSESGISVSAFRRTVKIDFGVLKYNEENLLTGFEEKPVHDFDVSMGIYCLSRASIEKLPKGKLYGFDHLMRDALTNNAPIHICPFSGYWLDIGRPDDYEYANANFEELAKKLGIA